jgi:hypothetical protein
MAVLRASRASGERLVSGSTEPVDDKTEVARAPRRRGDTTFAFAILVAALGFTIIFLAGAVIDLAASGGSRSLFQILTGAGQWSSDGLLSIAQIASAILGIALTVVAIVVQLAANRYTPKVIDLFIRDPVNVPTLSLFVVAGLEAIWVAHTYTPGFVPRVGILCTLALTTASLLALVPYFRHTFRFLEPRNVIKRIGDEVIATIAEVDAASSHATCAAAQERVIESLDHLFDIARNSVNALDRTLALTAVFSMRDIALAASRRRAELPAAWFMIYPETRRNPEFLSFPARAIEDFEREGTWLERKLAWQLHRVFSASLVTLRGLTGMVSLVVRELGEDAIARKNDFDVRLVMRTFNSFLRAAVNARDVRTGFNVLQQYRIFVEALAKSGERATTEEALEHFRYYGHIADRAGLGFVLETAAHDMALIVRSALDAGAAPEAIEAYLAILLTADDDMEAQAPLSVATRRGVRRAQAVLAAGLITRGREDLAREVADDMRNESPAVLRAVRTEILEAEREFFELTERVASFGYVPPEERPAVEEFFRWVDAGGESGPTGTRAISPAHRPAARAESPSGALEVPKSLAASPAAPPGNS